MTACSSLPGRVALDALASYSAESGAYVEGQAPYIECTYGSSEVAQGFVRACCVHGGLVALQQQPSFVLLDAERNAAAVSFSDGRTVRLKKLLLSDGLLGSGARVALARSADNSPACPAGPLPATCADANEHSGLFANTGDAASGLASPAQPLLAVMRGIVVLDRPLLGQAENVRLVVPPGVCGNPASVNIWHCSSGLRMCPPGQVIMHLSTPLTSDVKDGGLRACVNALTCGSMERTADASESLPSGHQAGLDGQPGPCDTEATPATQSQPRILLACFFRQAVATHMEGEVPANMAKCSLPGADVTMDAHAHQAADIFAALFPGEPFLVPKEQAEHDDEKLDALDAALNDLGLHDDDDDDGGTA
jgi:GDP dissociation inhibitor